MTAQAPAFYPVKITSRTMPFGRRTTKRLAWFAVGTAFGLGCASALSPFFAGSSQWINGHAEAITARNDVPAQPVVAPVAPAAQPVAAAQPVSDMPPLINPLTQAADEGLNAIVMADNSPSALPAPAPEPVSYPVSIDLKAEDGDTLLSLLTDAGVSYDEAHNAVASIHTLYDPKKLDVGQDIQVRLDKGPAGDDKPVIGALSLAMSPTASLELTRKGDDGFTVKKLDKPLERKLARAAGPIDSSLYETGVQTGLPPALVSEIISAYSYDVDFQRDIKEGDAMDVLYERMQTKDGAKAGHGNLLFAELDLGDRELKIFRYVDKEGHADYYNEHGESVRKALLRTPINGAHITSGFGMRNHPLLGYTKMHRGIDFGAPLGTPIYAAGDGTIEFAGRKGGYGNYLKLKHNDKYASAYGHISRFAAGIAPGHKVRQGQIIAYVGSTGMSTGPHLHYEILINNEQVNPANVKFKTGNVLAGREMLAFRHNMEQLQAQLAGLPRKKTGNDLAMAQTDKSNAAD